MAIPPVVFTALANKIAKTTAKKAAASIMEEREDSSVKYFDDILNKGVRGGQLPARSQASREWYRDQASKVRNVNERGLLRSGGDRLQSRPLVGNMYLFTYDAKHKDTLPYFDKFPLVFPYKKVKGGFMGINLHYLPLNFRAQLMDALYSTATNEKYDESTRLKLNYQILNGAAKFRYFKPCVKHYLTSQLKSRFFYIYPSEWDVALFMPLERFQGARKSKVFADSRKIIKG
tara:strand:+ start:12681 stop:13376 length:696 start_codon:yes stop_codon:yes gene_type:complete